jgi:hypothetical protein
MERCLACEAVLSEDKDTACFSSAGALDSRKFTSLGPPGRRPNEVSHVIERRHLPEFASRSRLAYHGLASEARSTVADRFGLASEATLHGRLPALG